MSKSGTVKVSNLKQAAQFIGNELAEGRSVSIPGFGKFYLSTVRVELTHPMSDDWCGVSHVQRQVHFRPFVQLKDAAKHRRPMCRKIAGCYHQEGEGHEGPCVDWASRRIKDKS